MRQETLTIKTVEPDLIEVTHNQSERKCFVPTQDFMVIFGAIPELGETETLGIAYQWL